MEGKTSDLRFWKPERWGPWQPEEEALGCQGLVQDEGWIWAQGLKRAGGHRAQRRSPASGGRPSGAPRLLRGRSGRPPAPERLAAAASRPPVPRGPRPVPPRPWACCRPPRPRAPPGPARVAAGAAATAGATAPAEEEVAATSARGERRGPWPDPASRPHRDPGVPNAAGVGERSLSRTGRGAGRGGGGAVAGRGGAPGGGVGSRRLSCPDRAARAPWWPRRTPAAEVWDAGSGRCEVTILKSDSR